MVSVSAQGTQMPSRGTGAACVRRGGRRGKAREIQAQAARRCRAARPASPGCARKIQEPARIGHAVRGERLLGDLELEAGQPKARLEQALLSRVLEHEDRPRRLELCPAGCGGGRQRARASASRIAASAVAIAWRWK